MNFQSRGEVVAMRLSFSIVSTMCLAAVTLLVGVSSCIEHADLQCAQDSVCDLSSGGVCRDPGTDSRWCSYPDADCPGGYRYSDVRVGDGLAHVCVPAPDAMEPPPVQTPSMQSCATISATCGETGAESCCASPEVTGGMFYRGFDTDGSGDNNSPATISSFRLDKFEVTVGRFRTFVLANKGTQIDPPVAGAGKHAAVTQSGWQSAWNSRLPIDKADLVSNLKCSSEFQTWTDAPGANENRPINCVTWYEAMAFCAWDGGYLPTEAEWNYAAAGGSQQLAYPWSVPGPGPLVLDSTRASYATRNRDTAVAECYGDGEPACTLADLGNVGSKPNGDGRWGQTDLAGNVREWTLDTFEPYEPSCTDCAKLGSGDVVVTRGGGFSSVSATDLLSGERGFASRGYVFYANGLRCARAPESR